jgi:hypothetical protein
MTSLTPISSTGNVYATLAEFKAYHAITSTNATDDSVVSALLDSTSRFIDSETARRFYSSTGVHYFDAPMKSHYGGQGLYTPNTYPLNLDDDCTVITSIVNGDGSTFTASDYFGTPYNGGPFTSIYLVDHPIMYWLPDSNGNWRRVIQVNGTWGYTPCPTDINYACLAIAVQAYHRRFGENLGTDSVVMPSGMVITPRDVPPAVRVILSNYRRIGMA